MSHSSLGNSLMEDGHPISKPAGLGDSCVTVSSSTLIHAGFRGGSPAPLEFCKIFFGLSSLQVHGLALLAQLSSGTFLSRSAGRTSVFLLSSCSPCSLKLQFQDHTQKQRLTQAGWRSPSPPGGWLGMAEV